MTNSTISIQSRIREMDAEELEELYKETVNSTAYLTCNPHEHAIAQLIRQQYIQLTGNNINDDNI